MKTATFPPLRVDPELREAAENVLSDGETLSKFAEQAIRYQVERRQAEAAFVARGLASRDKAIETGMYVSADDVLKKMVIARTKARNRKTRT